ncbi:LANO_0F14994g1_1 [Lachancea nothofagi CBS 11611]|uniref:LANO_0F14994g1_1 n=1 Tax=Lachancea nothofagi CBS 11611 TaxID=1266666 RepID=A0A1G4KCE4_9SACH|nr:LANO_0F14994g1_1 [Lachancea nothofagi CBS 11611]
MELESMRASSSCLPHTSTTQVAWRSKSSARPRRTTILSPAVTHVSRRNGLLEFFSDKNFPLRRLQTAHQRTSVKLIVCGGRGLWCVLNKKRTTFLLPPQLCTNWELTFVKTFSSDPKVFSTVKIIEPCYRTLQGCCDDQPINQVFCFENFSEP